MQVPLRCSCPLQRCSTLMVIFFLLPRFRASISSSTAQMTKLILTHKSDGSRRLNSFWRLLPFTYSTYILTSWFAKPNMSLFLLYSFLLCFLHKFTHSLFIHSNVFKCRAGIGVRTVVKTDTRPAPTKLTLPWRDAKLNHGLSS